MNKRKLLTLQTIRTIMATKPAPGTTPFSATDRTAKKQPKGDSAIIRETFSMPPEDSLLIDKLRQRAAVQGVMLNRSEILRAGLAALLNLSDAELAEVGSKVPKMKSGRPKSE